MTDYNNPRPFGLVFDTETTSQFPHEARVVSAYLAVIDTDGEVLQEKSYIVNPGIPIPPETTAIHGIDDAYAQTHGAQPEVTIGDIASIVQLECVNHGLPLIAHNASYDLTVVLSEAQRHLSAESAQAVEELLRAVNVLDSMVLDKAHDKYRKGKRTLIVTAENYGVELSEEDAHGASADALAAGRIVLAIMRKYPMTSTLTSPPNINYAELHERQKVWRQEQQASLQTFFRTKAPVETRDPNAHIDGSWPIQLAPARKDAA